MKGGVYLTTTNILMIIGLIILVIFIIFLFILLRKIFKKKSGQGRKHWSIETANGTTGETKSG